MKPVQQLLIASVLAAASVGASAQNQKPGLWEITTKIGGGGDMGDKAARAQAEYQKKLADMPPDKRKMVEDMMAQRGIQPGAAGAGGGMKVKVCLTKEMIDRRQIASGQAAQHGCNTTMSPVVGNTMKMSFVCTQPPSSGEGQFTFASPEAYTMQMTTHSTAPGRERGMSMEASGHWLSSDCGDVKPIAIPK